MRDNCQKPGQYICEEQGVDKGCKNPTTSKCVLYDGNTLLPIGIFKGENLNLVFDAINKAYEEVLNSSGNKFVGKNIGDGAEVYVDSDGSQVERFRTFAQGLGMTITQQDETILIGLDERWLDTKLGSFINSIVFENKIKDLTKNKLDKPTVDGNVSSYPYFVGLDSNNNTARINVAEFVNSITVNFSKYIAKPTTTINEPNSIYRYVALLDSDGNSVRIPAGNIGRNIFNYTGVTSLNSGLIQGFDFIWNINNKKLTFKNIGNRTNDISYNQLVVMNGNEVVGKADGKTVFLNFPTTMTSQEKMTFRTNVGYIARSSDDTLHVEEDDITLSTSLISEEFKGQAEVELGFEPISFTGIWLDGLRLDESKYRLDFPKNIKVLVPVTADSILIVTYNHQIY